MPFDGTELSPVTQALIVGRRKIELGWCQGAGRVRGSVCAAVAISEAPAEAVLLLQRIVGTPYIADWNDVPGRTKDEILAAYDRAITLSFQS